MLELLQYQVEAYIKTLDTEVEQIHMTGETAQIIRIIES